VHPWPRYLLRLHPFDQYAMHSWKFGLSEPREGQSKKRSPLRVCCESVCAFNVISAEWLVAWLGCLYLILRCVCDIAADETNNLASALFTTRAAFLLRPMSECSVEINCAQWPPSPCKLVLRQSVRRLQQKIALFCFFSFCVPDGNPRVERGSLIMYRVKIAKKSSTICRVSASFFYTYIHARS
jgi:hypothetical protein